FTLGDEQPLDLTKVDVVMLRQDPPFDMGYITTTHLLERLPKRVVVASDPLAIRAFKDEFGDIIVKPLYGNGGHGVFRVREEDENLNALIEFFASFVRDPLMIQRYVPQVRQGDK